METCKKMYIVPAFLLLVCQFLVLPAPAAGYELEEEFTREIALAPGGSFSLSNVNGDVELSGWDQNQVQIHAVKRIRNAPSREKAKEIMDALEIIVDQTGNAVEVKTRYPKKGPGEIDDLWDAVKAVFSMGNGVSASVTYKVKVPRNTDLVLNTVNGGLELSEVNGKVKAKTVNGGIEITSLQGTVETSTTNGSITVQKLKGSMTASTVNGRINADLEELKKGQDVELKTVNGSINLGLQSSASADLDISCVNGGIELEVPLTVEGKITKRNIRGTLGQGGPLITVKTVNGSIKILKLS